MNAKPNHSKRPIAVDLFCGAGGMSLGFEQAGFDLALSIDNDGHHVAAHARNFPHTPTAMKSIVEVDAEFVYSSLGGKTELDLVFGGPPCQGFSTMGLRDTMDPRNTLVDHFSRLIAELQPRAFVMENVPGMLTGTTREVLDRTVQFLTEVGYRITDPVQVLNAVDFGVPQKRKRLFVLGVRRDVSDHPIPYPSAPRPGQPARPTVWEAIADLPSLEDHEELFASNSTPYDKPPASAYARVARGLLDDPSDFSHPRSWDANRCTGCLRINHSERARELYRATPPGQMVPGHKLPKLDPNGICPTLRAGSDSSHGSYTAPRPIHPFQPRCISAREAARLHGFPDWFACYPLKWHAYRQIGNAVCPPVARAIGAEVMKALGYAPRKPSERLVLSEAFTLPEDRPRTLKRIPHLENYPPVVRYLFDKAFDPTSGTLHRSYFTFGDVEEAIAATGVNLSWTRGDTFVQEIARSRNRETILAPCLARGYSMRAMPYREFIGEFVPVGEEGAIDEKETAPVKSRELTDAVVLFPLNSISLEAPDSLFSLLEDETVVSSIWGTRKVRVELAPSLPVDRSLRTYRLRNGRGVIGSGCLSISVGGKLPLRTRIAKIAQQTEMDEVVAIVAVTERHFAILRFAGSRRTPQEVYRKVFELPNTEIDEFEVVKR